MTRALLCLLLLLTACSGNADTPRGYGNIRQRCIAINAQFQRLLPNPMMIEVGKEPNDGKSDTLEMGLLKIEANLRMIQKDKP